MVQIVKSKPLIIKDDSEIQDMIAAILSDDIDLIKFDALRMEMYHKIHDRQHPSIDQFLFDKELFLGLERYDVRPNILKAMTLITNPEMQLNIIKMILGKGSGKSFLVSLLLAYKTHEFLSYVNPQKVFGLTSGSPVALLNLSTNAGQAMNVIFKTFKTWVSRVRSFENLEKKIRIRRAEIEERYRDISCDPDPNIVPEKYREARGEIEFPEKNLLCISGHSKAASFYGYSVFAGTIDEADHIERIMRPKRRTVLEMETSYTEELFAGILSAIFTRFGIHGLLLLITTSLAKTAFLTSRVFRDKEISQEIDIDDGHIIMQGAPRIKEEKPVCFLRKSEEAGVPGNEISIIAPTWVMIPGKTRADYIQNENDVKAKRDLGCEPPDAASGAMPDPDIISLNANMSRLNAWDEQHNGIDFSRLNVDPRATYYFHADLALVNDNVGLCLSHYSHDTAKYTIDLYGNIFTSPQKPFDFDLPERILFSLQQRGFRIGQATFDGFQSADLVQRLNALGINAGYLSADKNRGPYDTLISLHMQNMIDYPPHPQYEKEMRYLEDFGDKYDHPDRFVSGEAGCFTGDTKVKLLDGRPLSFEELVDEFGDGKPFHVYSVGNNGKITVGKAHNPRITKTVTELVEIELDNGEKIRSTADHPYMLRDGEYCKAADLTQGTSLMPLYASIKDMDGMTGYEVFYDPILGRERLTHRMVGEYLYSDIGYTGERGGNGVIHHVDHNKTNNAPTNLEWCQNQAVHLATYHPDEIMKNRTSPEVEARRIENWNKYYDEEGGREKQAEIMRTNFNNNREKIIAAIRETGKRTGKANITKYNKSEKHREIARRNGKITIFKAIEARARRDVTVEVVAEKILSGMEPKDIAKEFKCSVDIVRKRAVIARNLGILLPKKKNHKVVSVRVISCEPTPVYDITVDDHHNFALSAGVFVHNSKDIADAAACSIYNCTLNMTGLLIPSEDMQRATEGVRDVNSVIEIGDKELPLCKITEDYQFIWTFSDKMAPLHNRSAYLDSVNDDVLLVIGYKQVSTFIVDFVDVFEATDPEMVPVVLANIRGMKCQFVATAPTAPWPIVESIRRANIRHVSADAAVSEKARQKHMRPLRTITFQHLEVMVQAIKSGTLKFCNDNRLVRELYEITENNYDSKPFAMALAGWLHYNQQEQRGLTQTPMPPSILSSGFAPRPASPVGQNQPSSEKKLPRSVISRR